MNHPIGIDLGTTNSVVAYVEGARAETIPNSEGQLTTPSVVLLREDDLVVGELAKRQIITQPNNTVRSVKRLMGQRYSEVKNHLADYFFKIVEGPDDQALIQLGDLTVSPEEVSAAILTKMRMTAEDYLSEEIDQAVITVPAHFNDSQRTATKRAAELAGLEVLRIINEPTAAALAYGIDKDENEVIAVFDFGGGTFDISILQLSRGIFEVLATNGDTQLGGDNLDRILIDWIVEAIRQETGCDPVSDVQALQRIRETAEKVKCELSSLTATVVSLPFIVADKSGPKHLNREITRAEFIELAKPVFDRLVSPCRQALRDSGVKTDDISRVLLVGGSTRIPEVRRIVQDVFKKPPSQEINPDEAVGLGAAIQSGIISGSLQEVLLLDIVPLSLGIELAGGVFKALIPRNSSIPTTATRKFTTVVDNQSSVMVHVLQGERKMSKENRTLARLRLTGIRPAPREVPEIEVKFHIDANGILQVAAQDMTTGTAQSVVVENYSATVPTQEEVERTVRDAQEHAAEDESFLAHSRQMERIQHLQHQMNRFLQLARDLTEQDLKIVKESMIKLDLAQRAREWIVIDTVEMQFKMIRGKYNVTERVGGILGRSLAGAEMSLDEGIGEAVDGTEDAEAPTQKEKQKPAAPVDWSPTGKAPSEQGEEEELVFLKDAPEVDIEAEPSGEGLEAPERPLPKPAGAKPLPRPKERAGEKEGAGPASASAGDRPKPRPAAAPASQGAPDGEVLSADGTPGAPGDASGMPKKFTPPAWLFPAQKKPPKE